MLILLSTVAIAGVYVPGYVIFKTTNPITVIQTEPQLLTDKAWFNQKITNYDITELHQIGADKIPAAYLSDRLYYYAVFDTVYAVNDVINSMKGDVEVVYAEPNYIFQPLTGVDTNDITADHMWGLNNIEMDRVWSELGIYGAPNIDVAVIDSGIDLGNASYPYNNVSIHPDLLGNVWQAPGGNYGWNYYIVYPPNPNNPPLPELINYPHDKRGHGTAVAGVISAINNNEFAVSSVAGGWSGIASGTKIMPFRVLQLEASYLACYYAFLDAYYYGARVINYSLGVSQTDMDAENFEGMNTLHELIIDMYNDTYNWGVRPLVVIAAGNNESEEAFYPACFEEVLAVGATDVYDKRGRWFGFASTLHSTIDIVAPGCHNHGTAVDDQIGIYSTFPNDDDFSMPYNSIFDHASGTSLAAPHVSGVAALILGQFPNLTLEQLRGRLLGTSDYIYDNNQAHLGLMGSGRLNAYRALTEPEKPNLVLNGINVNGLPTDVIEIGSASQRLTLNLKNWWSNATNVWGLLSTDDPNVSISYAGSNRIDWGNIQTEESIVNDMYVTINATGFNRLANFTLTVDSDANVPIVMTFTMKLQTSIEEDYFCVIPPGAGGLEGSFLNKNFTVKDINNDGFDEIFVTSRNGYLFIIHQNGSYVRKLLNMGTTCTPAVGDINSDGVFDIVVGNNNGQVLVFNGVHPYNLTHTINVVPTANKPLITFITLEDMNNDGQLDVVAVYEKRSDGVGINGFAVINMLDLQVFNNDTTYTIQHGVSVDDANNNGLKDVVYLCQNDNGLVNHQTNLYLDMVEVSEDFRFNWIYHNTIGNALYEAGSSPMIADLNIDGTKEIVFRYDWNNQGPEPLRSKKVGIKVYNYHPTEFSPIWEYPNGDEFVSNIVQNDNVLIGDFSQNPGLEILFSYEKIALLDGLGNVIEEGGILPDEQNTYQEYILAFDNSYNDTKYYRLAGMQQYYRMSAYDIDFYEDWAWKYNLYSDPVNSPIGMALAKTSVSSSGIIIPTQYGQISVIPVRRDDSLSKDYAKYRYNSRHTGSYNQPIPNIVRDFTEVHHNLYVENDMFIESDIVIHPNVRIVTDPSIAIRVYKLLTSVGNSDNGLQINGTCLRTQRGYWDGLIFRNGSASEIRYCNIRNATVGITYDDKGLHFLEQSLINCNGWGLGVYQANPIMMKNRIIQNSNIGIVLNNGASPIMGEDAYIAGYNSICENPVGIFSSQSNPLLKNGHNDIVNTEYNIQLAFTVDPISVQRNWWGSANPIDFVQKFNNPELVVFDPWDIAPNSPYHPQTNPFVLAMQYMLEEQYLQAIPLFHQVLADSVLTNDDHASVNSLLICYDKTDNLAFYRDFIIDQIENELPEKLEQWYKDCLALTNRSVGLFSEAIAYYESKLDSSTTLADSCYAMIDLGNTYLEADFKVGGKYSHLMPKSIQEHSQLTKSLLDKIFHSSSHLESSPPVEQVALSQNYPNPFNPSTTITFSIPKEMKCSLDVYNIRGQKVKTLLNDSKTAGIHSIVWDGKDAHGRSVSSGVYFYRLTTPIRTQTSKMLLMK
jgi:subtilisin family serine protease